MDYTIFVKTIVKEAPAVELSNIEIGLFDKNLLSAGGLLGKAKTNQNGKATIQFKSTAPTPAVDASRVLGGRKKIPEVYAVVFDPNGKIVFNTKKSAKSIKTGSTLIVEIPETIVLVHNLMKRKSGPSAANLKDKFTQHWAKRTDPGKTIDLCLLRFVMDTMSTLNKPSTKFGKEVVARLKKDGNLAALDKLPEIAGYAGSIVKEIDELGLLGSNPCNHQNEKEVINMLISPDGPLYKLKQGLDADFLLESPSRTHLTSKKGLPFVEEFKFQGCVDPTGAGSAKADIVSEPRINLVTIFQPLGIKNDVVYGQNVRSLDVPNKQLSIKSLKSDDGWDEKTFDLNRALGAYDAWVHLADSSGNQIAITDISPGQTIELRGSGFISETARVNVKYYEWETLHPNGSLKPKVQDTMSGSWDDPANSLNTVNVYGGLSHSPSDSPDRFQKDSVFFDWNHSLLTSPGLYELTLQFKNETDPAVPSGYVAIGGVCTPHMKDKTSQPVFLAVLPLPSQKTLKSIRSTKTTCHDETNPERLLLLNLCDDIVYKSSVSVDRLELSTSTSGTGHTLKGKSVFLSPGQEMEQIFWDSGTTKNYTLEMLNNTLTVEERSIDFLSIIGVNMTLTEIFGEHDKALLHIFEIFLRVAWTVFMVILILTITAITFELIAFMIYIAFATGGSAVVVSGLVSGAMGVLGTVVNGIVVKLWHWGFTEGIPDLINHIQASAGLKEVLTISSVYSGMELTFAGSDLNWHRAIYSFERPTHNNGNSITRTTTEDTSTEEFTGGNSEWNYSTNLIIETSI